MRAFDLPLDVQLAPLPQPKGTLDRARAGLDLAGQPRIGSICFRAVFCSCPFLKLFLAEGSHLHF
jgi:hypothetical protein